MSIPAANRMATDHGSLCRVEGFNLFEPSLRVMDFS